MNISPVYEWRLHEKRRQFLGVYGKIVAFSVVRVGPEGLEKRVPYGVAIVQVGKKKVMAQLTDVNPDKVRVGMKVEGVWRRLFDVDRDGVLVYGVKFRPVRSE